MDEEQAFFEQLTLSNFKMWSFTTLKDFNNYSVITTNISDNINDIVNVVLFFLLLIFELFQHRFY